MLEILLHWNPELKQSKNNTTAWIANYCPFCKYYNLKGRHFRYNTKLNVIKCFNCGTSCKTIDTFIYRLKYNRIEELKDKLNIDIEVARFEKVIGCETFEENELPF